MRRRPSTSSPRNGMRCRPPIPIHRSRRSGHGSRKRSPRRAGVVRPSWKPGPFASREHREAMIARLKKVRQALYPKVQELKENIDCQRWANVGVQEDLCGKVEALLARDDIEKVAEELRALDAAWKQASAV